MKKADRGQFPFFPYCAFSASMCTSFVWHFAHPALWVLIPVFLGAFVACWLAFFVLMYLWMDESPMKIPGFFVFLVALLLPWAAPWIWRHTTSGPDRD